MTNGLYEEIDRLKAQVATLQAERDKLSKALDLAARHIATSPECPKWCKCKVGNCRVVLVNSALLEAG